MLRSIALATIVSLLSAVVSTTAHADESTAGSDPAAAPVTPPGAVMATPPSSRPELPPQPVGRELLIGAGAGAGVALGVGAVAFLMLQGGERPQGDNAAAASVIGLVAYPLGAGLGVAVVGTRGHVYGSVKTTLLGAYLGAAGGALVGGFLGNTMASGDGAGAGVILGYLVGAPVGAAIAWNTTLADHAAGTGLVNVSGDRARLSIPLVSVTPDPLRPQGTVTSVRLMDGRF